MRRTLLGALFALLIVLFAACGDDSSDDSGASSDDSSTTTTTAEVDDTSTTAPTTTEAATTTTAAETTTTEAVADTLTILVTNDDGIGAPGIDELVTALTAVDDVEVVLVAPDENKSGSSDSTTPEGVTSAPGATASGYEGTAVIGFPADSVNLALDELGIEPDLVVSGVNEGQNVGPFAALSGTVGAARTAIRRGIPAVAASAGLEDDADFAAAAQLVVDWIAANRAAIADGTVGTDFLVSFNVPGCTAGEIAGLVEVPLATEVPEGVNPFETDCSIAPTVEPTDDVDAVTKGYASQTQVPADL